MKLTKAMKKLKFWSKKKKKKRAPLLEQPPPPLLHCYYHCPYYPIQPSAPPLPHWFDYEQQQQQPHDDSIFTTEQGSNSTSVNLNQTRGGGSNSQQSDNVGEINQPKPTPLDNTLPQQYMVPNQVYGGVPVIAEARTERTGGACGCVINFGAHLFRCFFPCFHIRELK